MLEAHELPIPAIFGAAVSGLAWISVFVLHRDAVYVGGGWMLFGLVFYVFYRRFVEETPLTKRVQVPETSLKKPPGVPHEAFNQDTEQARASMLKLAALDPAAAWPGHADALVGDVRGQLERAAAA